jgi:hypothetical protein
MWQLVIILTFTEPLSLVVNYQNYNSESLCRAKAANYRHASFEKSIKNIYASCNWIEISQDDDE